MQCHIIRRENENTKIMLFKFFLQCLHRIFISAKGPGIPRGDLTVIIELRVHGSRDVNRFLDEPINKFGFAEMDTSAAPF